MSLKISSYVTLVTTATLLAAFSLGSIVVFTSPFTSGRATLAAFYVSVYLVVAGVGTLIGMGIRHMFFPGRFLSLFTPSFRQALLIGILVVASLFLQSERIFYWWVEASIILFLLFIEIFFNL